jgi:cell fate regulator YaaT (PSP1 superfamily)
MPCLEVELSCTLMQPRANACHVQVTPSGLEMHLVQPEYAPDGAQEGVHSHDCCVTCLVNVC